jgi:glycosyltransferase involved in cell wall biosynthesis
MNIGGAPTVVYEQLKNINKEKFDPYLLTLYPSKKANFFKKLNFLPPEKVVQFNLKNRSIFDFKTLFKIYGFLKKEKFDAVYTHLFLANLIVRGLAILAKIPVILSFEHSFYYNKSRWQIIVDRILANFTDRIIVSVKTVVDFTAKQEGIIQKKFFVLPNPISIPSEDNINTGELRHKINIPKDAFIIMSLGRFSKEKGQVHLIEAADKLVRRYNDFYFILVGHGPMEYYLREEIKKRNIENRFKLVVDPENAKKYFYVANVFVLPSLREGQSMVLYEAMMAGLPVISSSLDGLKEVIKNKKTGLLVNIADSDELAEKIVYLYNNQKIRKKIAKNAKLKMQNYNNHNLIRNFEDLVVKIYNENRK